MTSRNNLQSNIFGKFTDQKDIPILPPMGSEEVLSEMAHIRIEELGSSISEKPIASRIVELCKEAGVLLTAAGATFPYGKDPKNNTLRIAPTFIDEQELEVAMDVFITAVQIAHLET